MEERYRRVGNKTRNGEFGACFYETRLVRNGNTVRKEEKLIGRKRSFNFVPEDNNADARIENVPRIFCARPGSRLWEVSTCQDMPTEYPKIRSSSTIRTNLDAAIPQFFSFVRHRGQIFVLVYFLWSLRRRPSDREFSEIKYI